jgi:23S rRNA (uracil1939-C5)-methyltransferase
MEVVLRAGLRTGDQMIVLRDEAGAIEELEVDRPVSVVLSGPRGIEPAAGQAHLVERLRERPFLIPAESFFQTNTEMAEILVDIVDGVIPDGVDLLVDAYSGVGTFAVCLADRARRVVAVETDARAVQAATMNASGLDNVTLIEGTASEGLAWLGERPDVLLVDPPRSGLSRRLVRLIADQRPPTIVYVSCEPATLARDARQLCSAGWQLAECRPIDMFPHTYHVESVTVFRR